jgi:hypothetical protein
MLADAHDHGSGRPPACLAGPSHLHNPAGQPRGALPRRCSLSTRAGAMQGQRRWSGTSWHTRRCLPHPPALLSTLRRLASSGAVDTTPPPAYEDRPSRRHLLPRRRLRLGGVTAAPQVARVGKAACAGRQESSGGLPPRGCYGRDRVRGRGGRPRRPRGATRGRGGRRRGAAARVMCQVCGRG